MYNIKEEDLKIIKKFINNYETTHNKYIEYKTIGESIKKNIIFQKYNNQDNNSETDYEREKIKEEIENQHDEYRKKFLIEQMKTLEEMINKIKMFDKINIQKKYMEMYCGNLSKYFEPEEIIEQPIKIYKPKEELEEKEYYYNKQTTITQIYIRIKYLYDFYTEKDKSEYFLNSEFIEKNTKFFEKFRKAIVAYNQENKNFINSLLSITNEQQTELNQKIK